ncbi:MAG TPA: hypothetical protein VE398_05260 [Acidobacteriota bacterium]|nr:hypothetical protein [Acidobacteriota bacterium]
MHYALLFILTLAAAHGYLCHFLFQKRWGRRLRMLERDLHQFSDVMSQLAEIQMKSYKKLSGNLGDMEERLMDLALPSQDSNLPLERRHHVLALARKGVLIDDIVKRLNMPRGEAELILNLRNYVDVGTSRAARTAVEKDRYAQA